MTHHFDQHAPKLHTNHIMRIIVHTKSAWHPLKSQTKKQWKQSVNTIKKRTLNSSSQNTTMSTELSTFVKSYFNTFHFSKPKRSWRRDDRDSNNCSKMKCRILGLLRRYKRKHIEAGYTVDIPFHINELVDDESSSSGKSNICHLDFWHTNFWQEHSNGVFRAQSNGSFHATL